MRYIFDIARRAKGGVSAYQELERNGDFYLFFKDRGCRRPGDMRVGRSARIQCFVTTKVLSGAKRQRETATRCGDWKRQRETAKGATVFSKSQKSESRRNRVTRGRPMRRPRRWRRADGVRAPVRPLARLRTRGYLQARAPCGDSRVRARFHARSAPSPGMLNSVEQFLGLVISKSLQALDQFFSAELARNPHAAITSSFTM